MRRSQRHALRARRPDRRAGSRRGTMRAKLLVAPLVGVLTLAGALVLATRGLADGPIKIGASLSLTGTYAAPGQNHHRGYQLCVKHVNDKGGVLGRKIEVVVY